MSFQDYMYSLTNSARLRFLNNLAKYGDPNAILNELFAIVPCLQNKRLDIRINQNFLLWHECKNFWHPAHTYLIETDSIKYCYHSYAKGSGDSTIGIIKNDDTRTEFKVMKSQDGVVIANAIRSYVKGFENIKPYSLEERSTETRLHCSIYGDGFYIIKNNAIHLKYSTLFRGLKNQVEIDDINDIIWCEQSFSSDSECGDTHLITLYLRKNKRKTYLMFSDSEYGNFQFILELKKRVPHLLYGHSEEYKKIHKRNPEELMAIAENKMQK